MKLFFSVFLSGLAVLFPAISHGQVTVAVHTQMVEHTMKGGLGASWHAIRKPGPWKNSEYDFPARETGARGSALEGNPPLDNEAAWKQLTQHVRWLGLNWVRVELSQLMYEPQKGKFDWDNEEMQTLYRILDYCQENHVDVFLQQMWTEVDWNAFPGVHPLISAPRSLEDFGEGLAMLVDYLVNQRHYGCIKWLCMTNEPPGGTWGYWWSSGSYPCVPLEEGFRAVRQALDRKGLKVPLSGPDWTDLPPFDPQKLGFDQYLGAYDIHSYQGVNPAGEATLSQWAQWAHERNKPFFLSEMGNMQLGWGKDNPGPRTFAAALSNAETFLRGIRAGVDGFNRWSFVNRGDLDGQWQLVRTWDIQRKKYLPQVTPEPVAYYGYGILTRFLSKYSSRLKEEVTTLSGKVPENLLTGTLRSPGGQLTTYLLNKGKTPLEVTLRLEGLEKERSLKVYQATEGSVTTAGYRMDPLREIKIGGQNSSLKETLPPASITVLSTFSLSHSDPGVIVDRP